MNLPLQQAPVPHLVERARQGDDRAFVALAALATRSARNYARRILGDADLAEDALQESLLDCHRQLGRLREPAAFVGWFRSIVFKQCDRIRRRRDFSEEYYSESPAAPARDVVHAGLEEAEIAARFDAALRALAPQDRRIAELRFVNDRPYGDIARDLEITEHRVRNRLRVIREILQEELRIFWPEAVLSRSARQAPALRAVRSASHSPSALWSFAA